MSAPPLARLSPPARERMVSANGLQHHVLEWGDEAAAETVVLCHGFLDLAFGFAQLAPLLAPRRVIAVDFRGHGQSGRVPPGGYYYFPDYVLDLHLLLPHLVSAPFHLVGHSMGGAVSVMYAATHGPELRSLSLLEGLGPPTTDARHAHERLRDWLEQTPGARASAAQLRDIDEAHQRLTRRHPHVDEAFLRALAVHSTCPHPSGDGLTWRFDPLHRTPSPVGFDAERFAACLRAIQVPTLVVQGELGRPAPDHQARVALLARAQSRLVAGAGHMLHWSHAREVAALLNAHFA